MRKKCKINVKHCDNRGEETLALLRQPKKSAKKMKIENVYNWYVISNSWEAATPPTPALRRSHTKSKTISNHYPLIALPTNSDENFSWFPSCTGVARSHCHILRHRYSHSLTMHIRNKCHISLLQNGVHSNVSSADFSTHFQTSRLPQ